jgi:hypothetical protein
MELASLSRDVAEAIYDRVISKWGSLPEENRNELTLQHDLFALAHAEVMSRDIAVGARE